METSDAALGRIIGAIGESDFGARTAAAFCAFTGFDLAALILHRGPRSADLLFDNFDRVGGRSGVETYVRATHRVNPMIADASAPRRSEEHTSELQSLMRISSAVFCLKKKQKTTQYHTHSHSITLITQ